MIEIKYPKITKDEVMDLLFRYGDIKYLHPQESVCESGRICKRYVDYNIHVKDPREILGMHNHTLVRFDSFEYGDSVKLMKGNIKGTINNIYKKENEIQLLSIPSKELEELVNFAIENEGKLTETKMKGGIHKPIDEFGKTDSSPATFKCNLGLYVDKILFNVEEGNAFKNEHIPYLL